MHHVRLAGTPAGQRDGPLLRPTPVEDLLAARDDTAVDVPGGDRRDLARGHGHHRLVEERDPFGQSAQADQGPALPMAGQRDQVGLTEAPADRGGLPEAGVRRRDIALGDAADGFGQQQVPRLDAVASALIEQAASAGKPAARAGRLSPLQEPEGQPERAARGTLRLVAGGELAVRASPDLVALRVLADQVGRGRQPLQVLGSERALAIGGREIAVDLAPGMALVG